MKTNFDYLKNEEKFSAFADVATNQNFRKKDNIVL